MNPTSSIRLVAGCSHPELVELIAQYLGVQVASVAPVHLENSELGVLIAQSLRDEDVYVIQTAHQRINEQVMELAVLVDALRKSSTRRITAVVPLFPYARQNRKDMGRAPICAKLVAQMLETAGCDHVVTIDLHAPQSRGFFDIPVDDLSAAPLFVEYLRAQSNISECVVVSPDAGTAKRAADLADSLDLELALIHNQKVHSTDHSDMVLVGTVKDKTCVVVLDIVDTCMTLSNAAATLKANGASSIMALATHGVFSGDAIETLMASQVSRLVCTNSVPLTAAARACPRVEQLDISSTLAEAVRRLHNGESISYLFNNPPL